MENILAFGLGIMLVTTIVLVYVVLKSNKKVNELNEIKNIIGDNINDIYGNLASIEDRFYNDLEKTNSKIDSRVDKLHDVMMNEINQLNQKADFLRRSLGKEY